MVVLKGLRSSSGTILACHSVLVLLRPYTGEYEAEIQDQPKTMLRGVLVPKLIVAELARDSVFTQFIVTLMSDSERGVCRSLIVSGARAAK
jgi:hypothetical protein